MSYIDYAFDQVLTSNKASATVIDINIVASNQLTIHMQYVHISTRIHNNIQLLNSQFRVYVYTETSWVSMKPDGIIP